MKKFLGNLIEFLIVFGLVVSICWAIYIMANQAYPSGYVPRIKQQQAYKMIKDIHEHLGLGE